jgi:uncharacterized membrane protein YgcG
MEIDELFGLPAHPLLVHIPIVVIPAATAVALLALWPRVRRPAALFAAFLALVGGVGAFLAVGAGEPLDERLPESDLIEEHASDGEAVELPAIVFAIVAVAGAVVVEAGRRRTRAVAPEPVPSPGPGAAAATPARPSSGGMASWATAVLAASVILGAYTTFTVVQAGHTGSKAVWEPVVGSGDDDGGGGGGSGGSGDSGSGDDSGGDDDSGSGEGSGSGDGY